MTPALPPTSCPEGSAPDATLQALPGALRQQPAYPGVTLTGVSFHATEHLPPDVPQATIVVRAAVHFTLGGQAHATPATIEALTTLLTARSAAEIQPLTERPTPPCTGRLLRTLHEATLGDVIRHVAEQCLTDHLRRTQSRSRALGTLAALMLTGMLLALTTKLLGGTSLSQVLALQAAHPDDAALAERAGALLTQIRAATEQHQGEARAAAVDAQLAQLEADVQTELHYLRDR